MVDISVNKLSGEPIMLAQYAGKVLLIVNVASECGFTPQYEGLEALYQQYKDRGFEVLGFPANNFGGQEPGTSADIGKFCESRNVTFPIFEKINVLGEDKHALYKSLVGARPETTGDTNEFREGIAGFLASKNLGAPSAKPEIFWNFEKFLVGRDGNVIDRFSSTVAPSDPRLTGAIEAAL